jgi:hypothetical protein
LLEGIPEPSRTSAVTVTQAVLLSTEAPSYCTH